MSDKKMNAESLRGTVCVLLSAVCFSTGGVLIKSIPWSSVTIQGARSIFSVLVVGCYMLLRRQKFVWNKTVLFGAVCNTVMAFAFVAATKLTTAANAIVLQFTEPVFVILLMWLIFHKNLRAVCRLWASRLTKPCSTLPRDLRSSVRSRCSAESSQKSKFSQSINALIRLRKNHNRFTVPLFAIKGNCFSIFCCFITNC